MLWNMLKYYTCPQCQKQRSKYTNLLDFQNALPLMARNHLSSENFGNYMCLGILT